MGTLTVHSERAWLIRFQRRMEAILRKAKLPHDAWREVEVHRTFSHHLDDPLDPRLLFYPPPGRTELLSRLVSDPKGTERAFWAAGAARIVHEMLEGQNPDQAFVLGRLLERFKGWLDNPGKQSADALTRVKREGSAEGGRRRKGKRALHVELLRRALCYDAEMHERGGNWLDNPPRRGFEEALVLLTKKWLGELQEIMSPEHGEEILLQQPVIVEDDRADFHFVGYVSKRKKIHLRSVPLATLRRRAQEIIASSAGC